MDTTFLQPVLGSQLSTVHWLPSSHDCKTPVHLPRAHVSLLVHTLPSSQAAVLLVNTQPVAVLQLSLVHGLASVHATGLPALHTPSAQMSPAVHFEPSSHALPVSLVVVQPTSAAQLAVIQGPAPPQRMGVPLHAPPAHRSLWVHALPSLQAMPLLACWQPCKGLQLSLVHGLLSSHM